MQCLQVPLPCVLWLWQNYRIQSKDYSQFIDMNWQHLTGNVFKNLQLYIIEAANISFCYEYTAWFSLHQVHSSQCTLEYNTIYYWRTLANVCMVSKVLHVVLCCSVLWSIHLSGLWMCPPGTLQQGTIDCPLPRYTSKAFWLLGTTV